MKKILALISVLALILSFAGCTTTNNNAAEDTAAATGTDAASETSGDDTATEHEPYEIEILTWTAGASTNISGIALADMINKNSTWLSATALASESQNANASVMIDGGGKETSAIGYVVLPVLYNGYEPFAEANEDLVCIAGISASANCFMTLDPDIKTLEDLDGKNVMVGPAGGYPRHNLVMSMLEYCGIEPNYSYGGFADSVDALINGQVDVIFGGAMACSPNFDDWMQLSFYTELFARFDVYFVGVDPDGMAYAEDYWNFNIRPETITVPAGKYYETWNEDLDIMCDAQSWCCNKQMPEDVVLEILNIMSEHADDFATYQQSGAYLSLETMATVCSPQWIYPAAKQFYIDNGVWPYDE